MNLDRCLDIVLVLLRLDVVLLGLDVFVLLEWDIDWLDVVLLLNNWLFLDVLLRLAIPGKGETALATRSVVDLG